MSWLSIYLGNLIYTNTKGVMMSNNGKTTVLLDKKDLKDITGNRSEFIRQAIKEKFFRENPSKVALKELRLQIKASASKIKEAKLEHKALKDKLKEAEAQYLKQNGVK